MEENKQIIEQQEEESSIDFKAIFAALKKHKKLYYKVLPATFVLAAIFGLSLHNYYKCEVMLSPELSSSRTNSGLAALASNFGLNLGMGGGTAGMGSEALFPTLYPDLVNSTDFKVSLFPIPVTIEGNKKKGEADRTMSYYDYLLDEQKAPWWSEAIGSAFKALAELLSSDTTKTDRDIDPFRLTKKQAQIVKALDKKVICDVDKKTMVITISVTDQDPVIAATMADSVKNRLQDFITTYRTKKAKVDLAFYQKICREAKARYDKARYLYAEYVDANQDIILESVRQRITDLENDMQLQYNVYTQVAAQLQQAEMKVQQETPAFTTLQSATVPVKKSGPSRAKICLIFTFLAFLGVSVWILNKENQLKPLLGLS
jgi:uncharacterized protein involved in exopolysaccharide biosynthesis